MAVRWTPAAANDLEQIARYLKEHHPDFAEDTVGTLYHAAESLTHFPSRGRTGRHAGTRELVVGRIPYVIVYSTIEQTIWISRILHTARDRR